MIQQEPSTTDLADLIQRHFGHKNNCKKVTRQKCMIVLFMKLVRQIINIQTNQIEEIQHYSELQVCFQIILSEKLIQLKTCFIQNESPFSFNIFSLSKIVNKLKRLNQIEQNFLKVQISQGFIIFSKTFQLKNLNIKHTKNFCQGLQRHIKDIQRIIRDFFRLLLFSSPQLDQQILDFDILQPQQYPLSPLEQNIQNKFVARQQNQMQTLPYTTFVINVQNFGERINEYLQLIEVIVRYNGCNNVIQLWKVIHQFNLCITVNVGNLRQNTIKIPKDTKIVMKRIPNSQQIKKYFPEQSTENIQQLIQRHTSKYQQRIWKQIASIYDRRNDKYKISHYLELRGGRLNEKANFFLMQYLPSGPFPQTDIISVVLPDQIDILTQMLLRIIGLVACNSIHSDFKPSNLRFDQTFGVLKIIDFEGHRINKQNKQFETKIRNLRQIKFPFKKSQINREFNNFLLFISIIIDMATPYVKNLEKHLLDKITQNDFSLYIKKSLHILLGIIQSTTQQYRPQIVKKLAQKINKFLNGEQQTIIIKPYQLEQIGTKFYDFYGFPTITKNKVLKNYHSISITTFNRIFSNKEKLCIYQLCNLVVRIQDQLNSNRNVANIQKIAIILQYLSNILKND